MDIGRKSRARRSPKWPAFVKKLLKGKSCACCGRTENLTGHHKKPFNLFPELELDPDNVLPLCEGRTVNCHLAVGHLFNWRSYNPNVDADAEYIRQRVATRPTTGTSI